MYSCLTNHNLVLASSSPRRQELLTKLGVQFTVLVAQVEEDSFFSKSVAIDDSLSAVSLEKARVVGGLVQKNVIIGADTVVILDGRVLGKPSGYTEASEMLQQLSGRSHIVKTGVSIFDNVSNKSLSEVVKTTVQFKKLSDEEISWYLEAGEFFDKAGAYGIQGRAGVLIEKIEGCYYNVVGLPINSVHEMLLNFSI